MENNPLKQPIDEEKAIKLYFEEIEKNNKNKNNKKDKQIKG